LKKIEKISIIGCGWFGLPMGKDLVQHGFQVCGSTTREEKLPTIKEAGIKPYQISLDPNIIGDQSFFNTDLLIVNLPPRKKPEATYQESMSNLQAAVVAHGISNVILISSTSVYSNDNKPMYEEDASYVKTPRSGISLLKIEDIWRQNSSYQLTTLRFAGLFGPERNPGRFLSGKDTSGAMNPVNMVHLSDCIGTVNTIIEKQIWNNTFNICSPEHPERINFYKEASKQSNYSPPIFQSPEKTDSKIINGDKFIAMSNYQYKFENPIEGLRHL